MSDLHNLKLILDIDADDSSQDELLELILHNSYSFIKETCGICPSKLPYVLRGVAVELAAARFNRLGAEGMKSEKVGPLSTYYDDISPTVMSVINKYKKVVF